MKNIYKITILILALIVLTIGFFVVQNYRAKKSEPVAINQTVTSEENSVPATNTDNGNQNTAPVETAKSTLVPPMDNFNGRITLNAFGNEPSKMQIDESQYTDRICPQGKNYSGYHTAVDVEVTPAERETAVPVYSIADGTVRQAGFVNGYGGLIVVEYTIDGQTYTAYYGHTNESTFTIKVGDQVKAGQKLAELGSGCTAGNGQTRKHLHFGMHKGKTTVVAGYVNAKNELNNWIDPREIIK